MLGQLDSNQCMVESKSTALPLGYVPIKVEEGGVEPPNPKEQIYSLPRLATSLFFHNNQDQLHGGRYRTRTYDPRRVKAMLSQLS